MLLSRRLPRQNCYVLQRVINLLSCKCQSVLLNVTYFLIIVSSFDNVSINTRRLTYESMYKVTLKVKCVKCIATLSCNCRNTKNFYVSTGKLDYDAFKLISLD